MSLQPGTLLGPYEILSPLGAGGMGEVYKARDTRLDRTVAIKVLPDSVAGDPQFRERFDREARAISHLTHPHICTLYDVGAQNGQAFLVMEHLEGATLAHRLANGALPTDQALRIAIEIASALDAAHRAGIIHRDLKPGNIVLTKSGAKLLDFGLAKSKAAVVDGAHESILPTTPASLTGIGTILGTLQYMAPEQLEGQDADARTDLFAFGAVLYELLAGRKAFEGKTVSTQLGLNAGLNADLFGDVALAETAPGLIVYRTGAGKRQFRWFDRTGRQIGVLGSPDEGQPSGPRLSPDGRTVLFRRTINGNTDLWSIEASRNILRRLTSDPARDYDAVWSPGGDRIAFNSDRTGVLNFYEFSVAGGSPSAETLLLKTSEHKNTQDWSTDGRYLLYSVQNVTTGNDLWVLPLIGDRQPKPIAQTAAHETRGRFSPDGRWVAYESNESGRSEIYVQDFPELTRKAQISTEGGAVPIWRGDGTRIVLCLAGRSTDGGADRGERTARNGHAIGAVPPAAWPTSLREQCRAVRRCS